MTVSAPHPTHPVELAAERGWAASAVAHPMRPLEFDLLARSFSDGFSRALTGLFGASVVVGVRLRGGHLETVKVSGQPSPTAPPVDYRLDYQRDWRQRVCPEAERHRRAIAAMGWEAVSPASAAALLQDAAARMTEITYLHHTLVLPARLTLVEFAEFAERHAVVETRTHALCLLAGRRNATVLMAADLWRRRCAPADKPLAQEGDGYGLSHPNWLEDQGAPTQLRRLYRELDDRDAPGARLATARAAAHDASSVVRTALRGRPRGVQHEFRQLWSRAISAAQVTEGHAPLMHARFPYALRGLVLRLGQQLTNAGLLGAPDEILDIHLTDLGECPAGSREFLCELAQHNRLAASCFSDRQARGRPVDPCYGDSAAAQLFRALFSPPAKTSDSAIVRGHPGSAGVARGPVRRVRLQADIGSVRPGDVTVTPDSASGWSFALPATAAVIAESGHPYGHLAALARDFGRPAVIGVGDTRDRLTAGAMVEVDGLAGTVRRLHGQPEDRR